MNRDVEMVCRSTVTSVEGAIACVVVRFDSNELLGACSVEETNPLLDPSRIANATELMTARRGAPIAVRVRALRGLPEDSSLRPREIQLTTAGHAYLGLTVQKGTAFVLLMARNEANLGLRWAQFRAAAGAFGS